MKATDNTLTKVYTLQEYATIIGCTMATSLAEIQEYAQEELDMTLWDYPQSELEYVLIEVNESILLVRDENGEVRVCEF